MEKANGVGLATPRVGILKRIVVINTGEGILSLVNPEIRKSEGEQSGYEGCLSVPDIYGIVRRPLRMDVRGINGEGRIANYHPERPCRPRSVPWNRPSGGHSVSGQGGTGKLEKYRHGRVSGYGTAWGGKLKLIEAAIKPQLQSFSQSFQSDLYRQF